MLDVLYVLAGVYVFIGIMLVLTPFLFKNMGGVESVESNDGQFRTLMNNTLVVLQVVFMWPNIFKPVRDSNGRILGFRGEAGRSDDKKDDNP